MNRDRRIPLPDPATGATGPRAYQPDLSAAIDGFYRAATRLHGLDPVLTEMVRLRCARHHDCRICKAVRLRDARDSGVDEAMTAKIDRFEDSDLDERIKLALHYTDAFITQPSGIDAALAARLRAAFTPAELVELSLDIMKWSTQKIHVTLGLDVMPGVDVDGGTVTFFEFDGDGRPTNFRSAHDDAVTAAR